MKPCASLQKIALKFFNTVLNKKTAKVNNLGCLFANAVKRKVSQDEGI